MSYQLGRAFRTGSYLPFFEQQNLFHMVRARMQVGMIGTGGLFYLQKDNMGRNWENYPFITLLSLKSILLQVTITPYRNKTTLSFRGYILMRLFGAERPHFLIEIIKHLLVGHISLYKNEMSLIGIIHSHAQA